MPIPNNMNTEDLNSGEGIFKFSDYFEAKQFLGQGAFGRVVLATDRETGEDCAVKVTNTSLVLHLINSNIGYSQKIIKSQRLRAITKGISNPLFSKPP